MPTDANTAPALSNCPTHGVDADVERAIQSALPHAWSDCPTDNDRPEFQLARELKAIDRLADAPLAALRPIVKGWHGLAREAMADKPFEETWLDFARAWKNVKFPAGCGPMDATFKRAQAAAPPPESMQFEQAGLRLLAALCRELQVVAGDGPFFLSCRTASRLLDVTLTKAWRWLTILKMHELIRETEAGTKTKAARYVYLATIHAEGRGVAYGEPLRAESLLD